MLHQRTNEKEIMDDLSFQGGEMDTTLRELRVINTWLGGNHVTLSGIEKLLRQSNPDSQSTPLRIADLGCGGGDMLILMAKWARKNNIEVAFTGIDANPYIVEYARNNSLSFPEITYKTVNVFSDEFSSQDFDIITCTLFCHHFDDLALKMLLAQLKNQVQLGIVVNDLHRHWLAYYSIKWLTAIFSKSPMVKNDAKLSVHRAFTKRELTKYFAAAGFKNISVEWKWAFRFQGVAWS